MTLPDPEHFADRPSWTCRVDGEPWPCVAARERLSATLGHTQLAMLMWTCLEEAAGDLPDLSVAEFFRRFIAWTRHPDEERG